MGDLDGFILGEKAEELGLIRREKYDPRRHSEQDAEPGDPWFVPVGPPRRVNTPRVGET